MSEPAFNRKGFQQYLNDGRLMGSKCEACGEVYLPPRAMCTRCYLAKMVWHEFSGRGVLQGFTRIHVGLPDMLALGYDRERPYTSGVVRLEEGPAISAQIVGDLTDHPADARVGMPARAVFLRRGDGVALAFKVGSKGAG